MIVLWVYGKTNSGKTSVCREFMETVQFPNLRVKHYDGDDLRCTINKNCGFDLESRHRAVMNTAKLVRSEMNVFDLQLVSMVTPLSKSRQFVRELLSPYVRFVLLDCSWDICKARDTKDLYCHNVENITCFEYSCHWDTKLDTGRMTIGDCVTALHFFLEDSSRWSQIQIGEFE